MPADRKQAKPRQRLSRRQEEILALLLEGMNMTEMAEALGIEHRTVRAHLATLRRKFGCHETRHLIPAGIRYYAHGPMIPKRKKPPLAS